MIEEIWKPVKDYENLYEVSTLGQVRNKKNKHILYINMEGFRNSYCAVILWNKQKRKHKKLHRLVAETFIPNPFNKPEVHHIDEDPKNCRMDNLEWTTREENEAYKQFSIACDLTQKEFFDAVSET